MIDGQQLERLRQAMRDTAFSGVVSIDSPDGTIFREASGLSNRADQLPNTLETAFGIASGTKLFTALGIARLVGLGVLSLDDRPATLWPDFRGWLDEDATIDHLLTHSSGCYDYLDEDLIDDYDNFRVEIPWCYLETPSDYLPLFSGKPAKFRPGSAYAYSNGGYVALGIVIECLSGRLYRDFIRSEVLQPAGMSRSGFFAFNELPGNTALGYLDAGFATNIYKVPLRGGGDGGMYTTAADMARLWQALLCGQLVPPDLLDDWLLPRRACSTAAAAHYSARGLFVNQARGQLYVVGGDHGVGFDSRCLPRHRLTATILSNQSDGEEDLRQILLSVLKTVEV